MVLSIVKVGPPIPAYPSFIDKPSPLRTLSCLTKRNEDSSKEQRIQADGKSDDRRISQNLVTYDQSETFTKISNYFESACRAMRNEREAKKSLLDNPADIGQTVETIYLDFLKQHIPAVCDVLQGGYVFDVEGCRSHQMDIIVHSGNAHRFRDSSGQACATLEGTVANNEVTSYLDRRNIDGDLKKFAFIPPTRQFRGLGNREAFKSIEGVQEWWSDTPKAVVAFDGVDAKTALEQINSFYSINHHVPIARRINIFGSIPVGGRIVR